MISYIGNLEKLLKRKKRGFWFAPPPPFGILQKLMIQRVQFIEGSDSRNEVLSETSDDDGG